MADTAAATSKIVAPNGTINWRRKDQVSLDPVEKRSDTAFAPIRNHPTATRGTGQDERVG
jgi:hypothetical protein